MRAISATASSDSGFLRAPRLATESGWSRRHLSQQFRSEFGVSPKVMSRVVRFERAKVLLTASGTAHLGTVAAMSGYADQSHMTREWNDIAGSSPAAWLAHEEIPFVQDTTSTERAS